MARPKANIVTIDAMGTQKAIAKQIIEQGGDYVLSLKGNQATLNEEVRMFLETEVKKPNSKAITAVYQDVDKGHGRIETRQSHWLIENGLHWTLDVVFNEDQSRIRKDNAGENMALVRHITLNMLNKAKKHIKNVGIKALRKKAGWGNKTLSFILGQNF